MRGDEVVQKKNFTDEIIFRRGNKIEKDDFDMKVELPLSATGTAADRTVYLSFQLDEDQLKYFRDLREAQAKAALTPQKNIASPRLVPDQWSGTAKWGGAKIRGERSEAE
jgi:hypothetical protein